MFGFEKLTVWQLAIEYADHVYAVTDSFPDNERFGLTSQLRRASVSVSSNIAEGSGRNSNPDFIRFVQIAYGSLMETVSQLTISQRRGLITTEQQSQLYSQAEHLATLLGRLRSSLQRSKP
ncbi:MAG: four helix bundle protein [Planctomycetaceae bacterium]|nr:four helix bundle protein [Planctomycetaceae bacterium]MCB9949550.1 four helix bundle protein [Planctomycetaceae bacterium]